MLKNILIDVANTIGSSVLDSNGRAWTLSKINGAAQEMYDSTDLAGCLREQVFTIEAGQQISALPYYVEKIRAVRDWNMSRKITLNDMRPRFQTNKWRQPYLSWRVLGVYPLARELGNAGSIILQALAPVTQRVKVTITGATSTASRTSETITFEVGDSLKTLTKSFVSVESVSKDIVNEVDIRVQDATYNELAVIPNSELNSRYTHIQVTDTSDPSLTPNTTFEILYKIRFTPFNADTDEFPCRGFDKAIYWKTLSHMWAEQKDRGDAAIAAEAKCQKIINDINANDSGGIELEMDFGKPRYDRIQDTPYLSPYLSPGNPYGTYGGLLP